MKKIYLFLLSAFLLVFTNANAQLTGIKNIPGDYATIASAVTDLNLVGVGAGGVTFNVAAGHLETITAVISITATGTLADPIVFQKNGLGANPLITAYTGTNTPATAVHDDIWRLVGSDYVTIDGIDLTDPNTTNPASMEGGFVLYKASLSDGAQNNTIRNCVITLNRVNNASGSGPSVEGSKGIEVTNSTAAAATTSLTPTTAAGTNSNNKFYKNTIQNCNYGIVLSGFAASTPFTAGDAGNDIGGGALATGNTILNFGGATAAVNPAAGIRANNQWGVNISYNTVNNNDGAGVNHVSTLRGIFGQAGTSANATISNNILSIQSGGTTSLCNAIDNGIGSTAASNTININSNTINIGYPTATTGVYNAIINSSSATTVNINSNIISQIAAVALGGTGTHIMIESGSPGIANTNNNSITNIVRNGASGSWRVIKSITPSTAWNCNNNTVDGLSWSLATSTGSIDGIYDLSSATVVNIGNNIVRNLSTPTTGTLNGININTVQGTHTCTNNQVYNFSTTAGGAGGATFTGIVFSVGNVTISGNTVYSLNSTGTTGGTGGAITGIRQGGGTTNLIFKNKIYDLSSTSTGVTVFGMNLAGGTTNTAYNNIIGDLRAPAANAPNAIRGIEIGSSNANVYYNTVYINGTSSGAVFGTTALNASGITNLVLRNNIFVNTSTANTTGFTAAYRRSSTTLTTYDATSNNNLFYAGTPGVNNLIFFDGTNSDQTLAAYKIRVAARDAASVTENPSFLSTTGASANFLHIDPTVPTQIESGGTAIGGITDDYDGDVRNGSTPDIGADEFAGIAVDMTGPSITYTPLGNSSCLTDRTLSPVTITDASGVNITAGTRPRLYFKKSGDANTFNDNTNGTDGWKFVEATGGGGSPFSFTTNYSLLSTGAPIIGETIQYFVVAQDLAGTPNVGINAGSFASTPASVALTAAAFPIGGTPASYTITPAGLSGIVNVGAAETFKSLTETGAEGIFATINANGLTGNTTVVLMDAIITETGATALNVIASSGCSGGPFTLIIKPNTTTTLTGSVASGALIKLNGADNVIIDGSNNGTTSRDLTIENTATTLNTAAIWVSSLGTSAGATNNTIKNSNIKAGSNTVSSTFGIYVGGTAISTFGTGNDNDNLTIQNNSISKAYYGIYAQASSTGVNDNLNINLNSIGNASAADYITFRGLLVSQATGANVAENTVFNIESANTNMRAMEFGAGFVNSSVSKNTITNINYTATSFSAGKGITLSSGTASANVTVSNNMISALKGHGSTAATNNTWGIMMLDGGGYNIYYNSINIPDDRTTTGSADVHGGIYIASTVTALNIIDNIISVTGNPGNATTGRMYDIYSLAAAPFTSSNYNDLFVTGTQHSVGFFAGANRNTLADWQAATGQDANSVSGNPQFISATNLHINTAVATPVESAGTPVSGITTDIDGDTRNATTPDIGADEGNFIIPVANDMQATAFISPVNGGTVATGVSFSPQASFTNNGTATQTNVTVRYRIVNASLVEVYNNTQVIASIANGITTTVTFDPTSLTTTGTYTIYAKAELAGDAVPANDEITGTITVEAPLCGTYAVGASQPAGFQNLTQAIGKLNSLGVSCAVVFALQADYTSIGETLPLIVNAYSGGSSTNTFTIKPAAGVTNTITGSSAIAIIKLNGADYVTIDGSNNGTNTKDLTIENTSTGTSSVVVWIASTPTDGATDNTVKNIITKGNGQLTTFGGIIATGSVLGSAAEVANTNTVITNNTVIKSQYGVAVAGSTTAQTGTVISNNTIGSATAADYIGFIGLFVSNTNAAQVNGNNIFNIVTAAINPIGINIAAGVINSRFDANRIDNVRYTGTGGYGGKGINVNTGNATSNDTLSNNMVSNIGGDGWNSLLSDAIVGIRIGANGGSNITTGGILLYHNTVNLSGSFVGNASGTTSAALYLSSTTTGIDLRNNILVTSLDNTTSATDKTWAINSAGTASAAPPALAAGFTANDYNDYVVAGAAGVLGFIGGDRLTLAGIQTGFGENINSVNLEPFFVSATDLHIDPLNAGNQTLDNLGTPITGVTTDFDNQTRSLTTPDMGADEFTFGSVLPVYVEYFRGSKQSNGNLLDWKITCIGTPYLTLTLERRMDQGSFTAINSINATSARCLTPFSYVDAAPLPGTNYYRLKFVDADGKVTYSNIVAIINKDKGFEIVNLAPNPVRYAARLNVSSATASRLEIVITDVNGKQLQKQTVQMVAGSNLIPLNTANLAAGTYQVTVITADGDKSTLRFVKL